MICQFWLFAGQCKSIADQRKLSHIGSKVAICVGDDDDDDDDDDEEEEE